MVRMGRQICSAVFSSLLVAALFVSVACASSIQMEIKEEENKETRIASTNINYINQMSMSILQRKITLRQLSDTGRQGTRGRLVFMDPGYSVALFESDQYDGPNAQALVDAEDSAAWFVWYGSESPVIADHCNQGFDIIKECQKGDTCYIVNGNDYQKYICLDVDKNGINEEDDLFLSSGYSFMRENDPGYLYMYTCNNVGDPYNITVAIWMPIADKELRNETELLS